MQCYRVGENVISEGPKLYKLSQVQGMTRDYQSIVFPGFCTEYEYSRNWLFSYSFARYVGEEWQRRQVLVLLFLIMFWVFIIAVSHQALCFKMGGHQSFLNK